MIEPRPTSASCLSNCVIQGEAALFGSSIHGQMMAVADGGSGGGSVRSVTSNRIRLIAGDLKTRWSDRLAAVTWWPRSRRKLHRGAPTWPVPPMTRIEGRWLGSSFGAGAAFGLFIDVDVSNHHFSAGRYKGASLAGR